MDSVYKIIEVYCKIPSFKSQKRKKLDFGIEQNRHHFFQQASSSLLYILFVAEAFRSREVCQRKGPLCDLFLSHSEYTHMRIWSKNNNAYKGAWVHHPYQVSWKSI